MFENPSLHIVGKRLRLTASVGLACALLGVVGSAPAQAALLSGPTCSSGTLSQPFLPWGDSNYYELIHGGDFEGSLSGWTLSGGAKAVAGNDPYQATGSLGKYSLSIPTGASAQTPFTCVNAAYPTFRFFARNDSLLSSVLVQVVYKTALGNVTASLGVLALSNSWQPSPAMLTNSIVGGVLSGESGQVAFRVTALTGSSRIDDLFLDPRMH